MTTTQLTIKNLNMPTLDELLNDRDMALKQTTFSTLVNVNPPDAWLKEHPTARGVKYLPIERVEWLLTRIFHGQWHIEVKSVELIANSVVVTVRLHYFDCYITNSWKWTDGVGAAPIQTDKEAGATDWARVKSDGVMKAAPAAESYALKDAAEKLGRIFGKDLNRKSIMDYQSNYEKFKD